MMAFRKAKSLVLLFTLALLLGVAMTVVTPNTSIAARCCWVMVCDDYGCWEECRPCPPFPPPWP